MARSFYSIFAFFSAVTVLSIEFEVQAFKHSRVSGSEIVLQTTSRLPQTCYCAKSYNQGNGICHYMKNKDEKTCGSRPCRPNYVCNPGISSGLLCIRRNTKSKVVQTEPGKCEIIPTVGYMYVPYSNSPNLGTRGTSVALPVVKPHRRARGLFLVVSNNRVLYKVRNLITAKWYLRRIKSGSRCIFEVQNGKVLGNPHRIAGYPQTRKYGFNKYWNDWNDITRMRRIAVNYYKRTLKPRTIRTKNIRGAYLVIGNNKVEYRTIWLNRAKRYLGRFKTGPRCIFEVRRGKVLRNPRKIAGYPQNSVYGFNRSWKRRSDIPHMYWIGATYVRGLSKKKKRRYLVVYGNRVIRNYRTLKSALRKLQRVGRTSKTRRCIFRVVNGHVMKRPYSRGNRYFRKKNDSKSMYRIAYNYMRKLRRN